jgi:DMSO/TMAO reductase YedYZ molybdopterin-dependent catalytic subunit
MAFVSGVVFAGGLGWLLLGALRRSGVVKDQVAPPAQPRLTPILLGAAAVLAVLFAIYLRGVLRGPATISIGGAVRAPFAYPREHADIEQITAEATMGGAGSGTATRYTGVPVRELLNRAGIATDEGLLLVRAADGYAFFVDLVEVRENPALLLAPVGSGDDGGYDLVGPANRKAWVRGVSELVVIARTTLVIEGRLERPGSYDPNDWQFDMDSTELDVGFGPQKLQGTPLGRVLASMSPAVDAGEVVVHTPGGTTVMPMADVLGDDGLRIYTVLGDGDEVSSELTFAIARMDGTVIAPSVTALEVR